MIIRVKAEYFIRMQLKKYVPFSQFLSFRYSPCVFCFASDIVKEEVPDYKEQILNVWDDIMNTATFKVRLIFPDMLPNIETVFAEFTDLRQLEPGSTEYDFLLSDPPPHKRAELEQLSLFRQRMFEIDFMPFYLWADLPISLLTIGSSTNAEQPPRIPIQSFPSWSRKLFVTLKANLLKLPNDDIKGSLSKWHATILTQRFKESVDFVEAQYAKYWTGWQPLSDKAIFTEEPTACLVALKFYADLRLLQGKFREARNSYQQLLDNTPVNFTAFVSQIFFLMSICDVMSKKYSQETLQLLLSSLQLTKNPIHTIQNTLVNAWLRLRLSYNASQPLKLVTNSNISNRVIALAKPFMSEQIAYISFKHHAALIHTLSAEAFFQIEAREHAIKALWNAYGLVYLSGWGLITQQLLEKIVQAMIYSKLVDFSDRIAQLLSSNILYHPLLLQQMMNVFKPNRVYFCGFAKARINHFTSDGFPCTSPSLREDQSWFMICERLFGAFKRGSFFSKSALLKCESAVGSVISLSIRLTTNCYEFPFSNIQALYEGDAEAESSMFEVMKPRANTICINVTPTTPGQLHIYGIRFIWGGVVQLYVPFIDNTLRFSIYNDVPNIVTKLLGDYKKTLFVGEMFQIKINVKNGKHALKHLALLAPDELPCLLIDPSFEDVCNQYTLPNLNQDEEITLTIAIHANKPGKYSLKFLFPYWLLDPPPKYSYVQLDFIVSPIRHFRIREDKSTVKIRTPPGWRVLGLTSPLFNANGHIKSLNGRHCQLDFMSAEGNHQFQIPCYSQPFFENKELMIWLTDGITTYKRPLQIQFPASVLVKKVDNDKYELRLLNTASYDLTDIKISLISSVSSCAFVVSGLDLRIVDRLQQGADVKFTFRFMCFDESISPQLLVACDQFTHIADIKL